MPALPNIVLLGGRLSSMLLWTNQRPIFQAWLSVFSYERGVQGTGHLRCMILQGSKAAIDSLKICQYVIRESSLTSHSCYDKCDYKPTRAMSFARSTLHIILGSSREERVLQATASCGSELEVWK